MVEHCFPTFIDGVIPANKLRIKDGGYIKVMSNPSLFDPASVKLASSITSVRDSTIEHS